MIPSYQNKLIQKEMGEVKEKEEGPNMWGGERECTRGRKGQVMLCHPVARVTQDQ